jgi:hypothetical protein
VWQLIETTKTVVAVSCPRAQIAEDWRSPKDES